MNELECMRTFVKVAEVGSFTETARQMNCANLQSLNVLINSKRN